MWDIYTLHQDLKYLFPGKLAKQIKIKTWSFFPI